MLSGDLFGVWDYVVFCSVLCLSVAIGIYYAFSGGRQKTTSEYLTADRSLRILPVAISLMVSYLSTITILGNPSEMYFFGAQYWIYISSFVFAGLFTAVTFVPLLYPLKITSAQEYLVMRFKRRYVALMGTVFQIIGNMLIQGIILLGPAVALKTISPLPIWATITVMGLVTTVYTTIGGMKAVIWTDVFQSFIILIGLLAVVIKGVIMCGGMGTVWKVNGEGKRLFVDFSPSPFKRFDFWSLSIVQGVSWVGIYGIAQSSIQRYQTLKTLKDARRAVFVALPPFTVLGSLAAFSGMVAYAYYHIVGCDPYRAHYITNQNQIMIYFVADILYYPGMLGLFISCCVAGSISNFSSALNAISAIVWTDILSKIPKFAKLEENHKALVTKFIVLVAGLFCIINAIAMSFLKGTFILMTKKVSAITQAPLITLFLVGGLIPRAGYKAVTTGSVLAVVFMIWLNIESVLKKTYISPLPTDTSRCVGSNISIATGNYSTVATSFWNETTVPYHVENGHESVSKSTLSPIWFTTIGVTLGLISSYLASYLPFEGFSTQDLEKELYFPITRYVFGLTKEENAMRNVVKPRRYSIEEMKEFNRLQSKPLQTS